MTARIAAGAAGAAALEAEVAAEGREDAEGGGLGPKEGERDCGGDLRTAMPNAGMVAPPASAAVSTRNQAPLLAAPITHSV